MAALFTHNWFDKLSLLVSLALTLLSTFEVSRRGWFRVRPVLSIYACFLAISSSLLVVLFLLQIPDMIRYSVCRAYLVIYYGTNILDCVFVLAVLYEFLFLMAGSRKTIRKTAIGGFIITISLTAIAALAMLNQSTDKNLQSASQSLAVITALALVASGLVIFFIKKFNLLFLEPMLSILLAALALAGFFELLGNYLLRGRQQISLVFDDVIWLFIVFLMYRALKSGPTNVTPATTSSAGFTP
jgi:uncharacterized membrane protein